MFADSEVMMSSVFSILDVGNNLSRLQANAEISAAAGQALLALAIATYRNRQERTLIALALLAGNMLVVGASSTALPLLAICGGIAAALTVPAPEWLWKAAGSSSSFAIGSLVAALFMFGLSNAAPASALAPWLPFGLLSAALVAFYCGSNGLIWRPSPSPTGSPFILLSAAVVFSLCHIEGLSNLIPTALAIKGVATGFTELTAALQARKLRLETEASVA